MCGLQRPRVIFFHQKSTPSGVTQHGGPQRLRARSRGLGGVGRLGKPGALWTPQKRSACRGGAGIKAASGPRVGSPPGKVRGVVWSTQERGRPRAVVPFWIFTLLVGQLVEPIVNGTCVRGVSFSRSLLVMRVPVGRPNGRPAGHRTIWSRRVKILPVTFPLLPCP